jgi:hypothetical protein
VHRHVITVTLAWFTTLLSTAQVDCGIGVERGQQDLERQVCHLEPGSAVQQRGNGVARTEEIFCGAGLYRGAPGGGC